ncbi:MAG: branched-chain amino acid ABC transporter permease [Anaerolineales bacterium]|nr:branched-chain amino acid ABC transporter permease [Anaerolineales bacterium]
MWGLLDSLLQPILDLATQLLEPLLERLATVGLSEPVVQFMLMNAILGVSIYLTLNCGMFSLANAGFMAIGAYVGAILTTQHGATLGEALLYGMLVAGIIAIPVGLPVLRLRNIYLAIATIGFGEIVRLIILHFDTLAVEFRDSKIFGPIARPILKLMVEDVDARRLEITLGARGITRIPVYTETAHLVVFLLVLSYFLYRLHHSRMGRAMAAIRQDERVAASQGINVVYYKNVAFVMGAMLAGAAGVFNALATRTIEPKAYGFDKAVDILAYAVLGGLGNWLGPILGGLTLTAIPELLRELREYSGVVTGVILLLIIVYLPGGLTSLMIPSFWRNGGRYEFAKRVTTAGVVLVGLVNVLPYQIDNGRILGYEFWGLIIGNMVIVGLLLWVRYTRQRQNGGHFSLPLMGVGITGVVLFIALALVGKIDHLAVGYYVHLIGMALVGLGGWISYPAEER